MATLSTSVAVKGKIMMIRKVYQAPDPVVVGVVELTTTAELAAEIMMDLTTEIVGKSFVLALLAV